jgi:hypothetical protein
MNNIVHRLLTDLPYYAENNLRIKPKVGAFIPFAFNKAQIYLHNKLEEQKKKTGKVRALILKGRQQGCSTYVAARFYHRTVRSPAIDTFIFAHDATASDSLFTMVKNYHELSDIKFRPILGKSNSKELLFTGLKSGYKVGTAGTKGLGRSKTFQNLHWSEVAYSKDCDEHSTGILQTVADAPDTEIILESTSNGQGDFFHRMCMAALSDDSDFILIFIPWYWQDEYIRQIDGEFQLERPKEEQECLSEQEYYDLFAKDGLTLEHLNWRRNKIKSDFQGDVMRFMREYPFTPQEAFQASDENSYIKASLVLKARATPYIETSAPLVIGVDPAREGKDRICLSHRRGRNLTKYQRLPKMKIPELARRLAQEIDKYNPTKMFIDVGGLGVGVYDMLVDLGYDRVVVAVNFGGKADNPDLYANKRAEMYGEANDWLQKTPCHISTTDIAAADALQAELCSVGFKYNSNQALILQPKEELKKKGLPSPDLADSFVLTFAFPVAGSAHGMRQGHFVAQMGKPGR